MPRSENKIFLDANIIIAAALSSSGGSFRLITEASLKEFQLFSSDYVLQEAVENLKEKYPNYLASLNQLILFSAIRILKEPSKREVEKTLKLIDFKDAPILACALKHKMDFLITLDRAHFFTPELKKHNLPIAIFTPKDFFKNTF